MREAGCRIFISYRRKDTSGFVGMVNAILKDRYLLGGVFLDTKLEPGPFPAQLEQAIEDCDIFLVFIGKKWLVRDKYRRRRIDQPDDWVRREIKLALALGKLVVPVLVDGARMPAGAVLPEDIRALADQQAFEIHGLNERDVEAMAEAVLARAGCPVVRQGGGEAMADLAAEIRRLSTALEERGLVSYISGGSKLKREGGDRLVEGDIEAVREILGRIERRQKRVLLSLCAGIALVFAVVPLNLYRLRGGSAKLAAAARAYIGEHRQSPEGVAKPVALALHALARSRTREAEEALHEAMQFAQGSALEGHGGRVNAVSFSPDGTYLITASDDGTAILWDSSTYEVRDSLAHPPRTASVALSRSGAFAATAGGSVIRTWRTDESTRKMTPWLDPFPAKAIARISFLNDRSLLSAGEDGQLIQWDLRSALPKPMPGRARGVVRTLAVQPGKDAAVTGGVEGVELWDLAAESRRPVPVSENHQVNDLAFSRDGRQLAIATAQGAVFLWDMETWRARNRLVHGGASSSVNAVAFNAVGDRLVSAEASGNAHLWDLAAGKDILTLRAASEGPLTGASLPHYSNAALSHRVALAGASGVVRIYNLDLESLRDEATELVKRQQPSFTKEECGSYFRRAGCAALPSGRWAYFFFAR
jgi:hypothetical protein